MFTMGLGSNSARGKKSRKNIRRLIPRYPQTQAHIKRRLCPSICVPAGDFDEMRWAEPVADFAVPDSGGICTTCCAIWNTSSFSTDAHSGVGMAALFSLHPLHRI